MHACVQIKSTKGRKENNKKKEEKKTENGK